MKTGRGIPTYLFNVTSLDEFVKWRYSAAELRCWGLKMSKMEEALQLVEGGMRQAEAARQAGVSRQALNAALKAQASGNYTPRPEPATGRICSECKGPIPDTAQAGAVTCCPACRVKRTRRLKKEGEAGKTEPALDLLGNPMSDPDAERLARIAAERALLGLPPWKA